MRTLDLINGSTISYAQNREDLILAGFFEQGYHGFYVDVGANDPEVDSVTKIFYQNGWTGLNIEPIKSHFKALQKQRKKDLNENIGIATKKGTLKLREYTGSGLSTFSETMKREHQENPTGFTESYLDYEVPVEPLKAVFTRHNLTKIDFMKVDVEGYEYDVLASNDWDKYRPKVLCIEANHIDKDWRPLLVEAGYRLEFFDSLNEYYVDARAKGLKRFSYVDAVVSRQPIVTHHLAGLLNEQVDNINAELSALEDRAIAAENKQKYLARELEYLRNMTFVQKIKQLVPKKIVRISRRVLKRNSNQ
jgi:FkbM family methyltransferase